MSKLSDRLDAAPGFAAAIAREAEERAANAHLLTPHPPS